MTKSKFRAVISVKVISNGIFTTILAGEEFAFLMDHFPNLIPGAPVAAARSNGQSPSWIACVVGYPRIM
ncbi:hypothetical protein PAPYR_13147 [Paratrimastix pyriformis]|uniref:Uncharacterized protein n=1 Tax=Paratrimastix pyriformis TaxID=342808 RepID=A0ABQ8U356_9EUKA|nr:hypothetical protein PAPYR_13147 [Paratrimastix pyriformis]